MIRWIRMIALTGSVLAMGRAAPAEAVLRVPYDPLMRELGELIDFEDYPRRLTPGTRLDAVQAYPGAAIGERFAGQAVSMEAGFEVLSPRPFGPLRLEAGRAGENLAVAFILLLTNQLSGVAPPGYPDRDALGEGAISILFDADQAALGFRATAEPRPDDDAQPNGRMQVAFFRRDGALIERLEIEMDWARAGYGFRRAGGLRDIAGISITNRDPAGIAIDDVIYDTVVVTGRLADPDRR